ncbi:SPFH domain-containing protein [Pelagicoccus mobilis]|uniref:SPFH domain-containing protein n=1 Tax=Pelagicoccus mobilis TaxID=415221 RepID=A0A934RYH5_9BACT|nr:SPFH domain-containing protein [Pelagicoccus mobilis]MBK1878683.1 SPFH domain-containing protein [Pelagicoccus mobilis]
MKNEKAPSSANAEKLTSAASGWTMISLAIFLLIAGVLLIVSSIVRHVPLYGILAIPTILSAIFVASGVFTLQPNTSAVLILFGSYKGTVRESGFLWRNPLMVKKKVSLRARNLNGDKLKVNDMRGNPIEIAAVVVWKVDDTAQASFDVDNYEHYVSVQSESAVRHLASSYAYDQGEGEELTLRSSADAVNLALQEELQERLAKAGVQIEEARLTHLAYAPEIAQVMLRRQQAEAIVAARSKIVQGAVGMVDMALKELDEHNVVDLDSERKATMVSNLLVVLCGDQEVHPVVNTGTLYT